MPSTRAVQPRKNGARTDKLTPKQRMFIQHLLASNDFNLREAAEVAGYAQPSAKANDLIKKREIRAVVGKELQRRINECRMDADSVLKHLAAALYLDPLDLFNVDPSTGAYVVKKLEDIPQEVRRCITKIKQRVKYVDGEPDTYFEVELMSKDAAMSNALKHLGLVSPDKNNNNFFVGQDVLSQMLDKVEEERQVIDQKTIDAEVQ